jgi:uncharacterized metal-binding protein YceD (DUF177 family)
MAEFELHVPDLDEHGKDYTFAVTRSWLAGTLEGVADVRAPAPGTPDGAMHVSAQKIGAEYLVRGTVDASLVADCYRCLEDVPLEVHAEVAVLFRPGPAAERGGSARAGDPSPRPGGARGPEPRGARPRGQEARAPERGGKRGARPAPDDAEELDLEGPDRETFAGDAIVLDGLVRELLLLEVPMQPLCRDDCPGIAVPEHVKGPADLFGDAGRPRTLGGALRSALGGGAPDGPAAAGGHAPKKRTGH